MLVCGYVDHEILNAPIILSMITWVVSGSTN
jgi:hypothetical protein